MPIDNKLDVSELADYDYQFDDEARDSESQKRWPILKSKVERLLYFCAGVDLQLMQKCPHADRVKEQCIGGTVLATAVLAFLTSSYAFYTVFSPKPALALEMATKPFHYPSMAYAIFFGLVWSLMIFNLDRFIVSSTGHGDGKNNISWSEIRGAIPRILMAIAIGLVLSAPLEIKIMESEINAVLMQEQRDLIAENSKKDAHIYDDRRADAESKKAEFVKKRDEADRQLKEADDRVYKQTKDLQCEIDGTCGSGRRDLGPSAKRKQADLDRFLEDQKNLHARYEPEIKLIQSDVDRMQKEIDQIEVERANHVNELSQQAASLNGLMKRIRIAHSNYELASWLITILLILIEIAPIIFKMMTTLSPYDYFIEDNRLKTLALRGINLNSELKPNRVDGEDAKAVMLKDATYREADILKENQLGKLDIEGELTKLVQDIFKTKAKEEVQKNQDRYISSRPISEINSPSDNTIDNSGKSS
jgi:hypothetical protein